MCDVGVQICAPLHDHHSKVERRKKQDALAPPAAFDPGCYSRARRASLGCFPRGIRVLLERLMELNTRVLDQDKKSRGGSRSACASLDRRCSRSSRLSTSSFIFIFLFRWPRNDAEYFLKPNAPTPAPSRTDSEGVSLHCHHT